ncbi:MAG: YchF/TatD family DNA exonuclease [Alphaproteobacteria bacterium]|uniref:YchF/TatD family DNA exonuclease n=1 Tax=Candidatus Nitrobium versatile TaxID=2884831 RepID=A0A953JGL6_9BACT|nr:YchF/TatD family DNA exonuclease [Candidatus Nitrobium versatile]
MIDTHCHLEMKPFDEDRGEVIARAREHLEAVITIGSDLRGCEGAVALAEQHDFIYATVGIHPHDAKGFNEGILDRMRDWVKQEKVVAVGETGLDYHYDHSPREVQREVFRTQLCFAGEAGLPVVVHSREAKEDTLGILEESGVRRGVLHCFSGDRDMAERAMAMGFHISFAGPVTFKKAAALQEIAKAVPDEFLLVETDAPYLTPEPYRGRRNEPAYVVHTARFLAQVRGVTPEDIDRITSVNAKRLFGIGEVARGQIAYKIRESLYLNVTNRCTSKCVFCVRFATDFVKGHNLRLEQEPAVEELKRAVGDPTRYREIVFCGYGEPLLRLDAVKAVAAWVKEKGGRVRVNTNGHGNLIHKRNILPELQGAVDVMSISLDAQDAETYDRLCKPAFRNAFQEVVQFIREAKKYIPAVQATVVTAAGVDVEKCREITDEIGVELRVRKLDAVG